MVSPPGAYLDGRGAQEVEARSHALCRQPVHHPGRAVAGAHALSGGGQLSRGDEGPPDAHEDDQGDHHHRRLGVLQVLSRGDGAPDLRTSPSITRLEARGEQAFELGLQVLIAIVASLDNEAEVGSDALEIDGGVL